MSNQEPASRDRAVLSLAGLDPIHLLGSNDGNLRILRESFSPQGMNIGLNVGHVAGAGYAEHIHVHVVPRWSGDTNFMAVTADTRVVPEALADTYRRLKEARAKRAESTGGD